ncbi:MAG TPA: 2-C-methyl-D-erythritol 4-phosphate cytidylyltransferase [Steroidobacteraceae bacterium]|nr:2-C-methyl-D-erythritol 4-phosphate cytidylyltransferase [Steroidobacteraceae bacterium]
MRYWLVMPAAGVGRRFGENIPKQYAELHGRTVMEWSMAPFLYDSRCLGVVVVLGHGDAYWPTVAARLPDVTGATRASGANIAAALADATRVAERAAERTGGADTEGFTDPGLSLPTVPAVTLPKVITATGGGERSHSVRNGLAALSGRAASDDWVLVHDAARPCVSRQDVDRLLDRVQSHAVGGILAAPAADTLKRAGESKEIIQTIDRTSLWRALTPQMFRYTRLCEALDRAHADGRTPTDEAQALEWTGERPIVVEGSTTNLKITSADDLVIAVALMAAHAGISVDVTGEEST